MVRGPGVRRAFGLVAVAAALALVPSGNAHAAIAFRSASSASAANNKKVTVTKPAGTASGDVLVASVVVGFAGPLLTISPPAGWTAIRTVDSGATLRQTSFYKVAGGSEPASYAFSVASGSQDLAAGIAAYSGANTTAPIDVSAGSSGASGNATAPSVTTGQPNDQVLVATAFNGTLTGVTPDPSTTERFEVSQQSATAEASDFAQASPGATGSKTVTPSSTSFPWAAQTIALAPPGTLSVTANGNPSFSLTLDGTDSSPSFTEPLTVTDTRGTGAGWNVQITSTTLATAGGATLPTSASIVTGVSQSCISSCTTASNSVTYPFTVPAAASAPASAKLFNAAAASGLGTFTVTPTIAVHVPANARAGTYSSTHTVTIATGP